MKGYDESLDRARAEHDGEDEMEMGEGLPLGIESVVIRTDSGGIFIYRGNHKMVEVNPGEESVGFTYVAGVDDAVEMAARIESERDE